MIYIHCGKQMDSALETFLSHPLGIAECYFTHCDTLAKLRTLHRRCRWCLRACWKNFSFPSHIGWSGKSELSKRRISSTSCMCVNVVARVDGRREKKVELKRICHAPSTERNEVCIKTQILDTATMCLMWWKGKKKNFFLSPVTSD